MPAAQSFSDAHLVFDMRSEYFFLLVVFAKFYNHADHILLVSLFASLTLHRILADCRLLLFYLLAVNLFMIDGDKQIAS